MLNYEGILIEGENANVINFLHGLKKDPNKKFITYGKDEINFLKEFKIVIFSRVSRYCNKLANRCANIARNSNFVWNSCSW